jgi:T4 RnlA family RNA ligase
MNQLDTNQFKKTDCNIGGDDCVLVVPYNIGCTWTEETLEFRSLIFRKSDNKVISRGFKKFFNWGEKPEIDPFPAGPFDAYEKKDGSLIIWGCHNGTLIHRTRGTVTAETLPNGHEISFLKEKYPKLISAILYNPEYSILTEWETPNNVIVLNEVREPTLTLIGAIHNKSGKYLNQEELDKISEAWDLCRPKKYSFDSISECISDVNSWIGREGIVVYSHDGQSLRKIKSNWYCEIHKMVSGLSNIETVIDIFIASPKFTKYSEFYSYIERMYDYEIAEKIKSDILKIVTAYSKVVECMQTVECAISHLKGTCFSKKEQAYEITLRWNDWKKTYAFLILQNKKIPDSLLKKTIKKYL